MCWSAGLQIFFIIFHMNINIHAHFSMWVRQTVVTFVVGQQIEESLSNFLSCERLRVLQAVQQGANGVVLSLSVHRSHSVPVRKLTFSEEVQDVPLGDSKSTKCPHKESDFKEHTALMREGWQDLKVTKQLMAV